MRHFLIGFCIVCFALPCSPSAQAAMGRDDFIASMLNSRPYFVVDGNRVYGENIEVLHHVDKSIMRWRTPLGQIQLEIQTLQDKDLQLQFSLQQGTGESPPGASTQK